MSDTLKDMEVKVRVEKTPYRWLWLTLLVAFFLLLLLRFSKDVSVVAYIDGSKNDYEPVNVEFTFVDYALIKTNPLRFFVSDEIFLSKNLDSNGTCTFTDVKYTLYSVLFHPMQRASVRASSSCLVSDTLTPYFRKLRNPIAYRIPLKNATFEAVFRVLDSTDHQPICNASVKVAFHDSIKELLTDFDGYVKVSKLNVCDNVNIVAGAEFYSSDTLISDMETVLLDDENRTLLLSPRRFDLSLVVKNADNQRNVSSVRVSLIDKNDSVVAESKSNSKGKVVFRNVLLKDSYRLGFMKSSYRDTLTQMYQMSEIESIPDTNRLFFLSRKMRQTPKSKPNKLNQ